MTTNRTPEESSAVEYQFTLTIESRTPITNLDVLSSLEIDFDDADSIACDPVVKESLTVDTAYREGFEAAIKIVEKLLLDRSQYHDSKCLPGKDRDWHWPQSVALNDAAVTVRSIKAPTTKGQP